MHLNNRTLSESPSYKQTVITTNPKYNFLHIHSILIKILTLSYLYYLIYKPFSGLFVCPIMFFKDKDYIGLYY